MYTYIALLHPDPVHPGFRVTFPDFPGLICTAVSLELARPLAEAALANEIEEWCATGRPVPEALPLQQPAGGALEAIALPITVTPYLHQAFGARCEPVLGAAA